MLVHGNGSYIVQYVREFVCGGVLGFRGAFKHVIDF